MTRRYKSYKDALHFLASNGNSNAGATAARIKYKQDQPLVMQHKKCAVFEVFDAVFGSSPNARPVDPKEVGGEPMDDSQEGLVKQDSGSVVVVTRFCRNRF